VRTAAAVLGGVVVGLIVAIGLVVTLGRNDSSRRESAATSGAGAVSTSSAPSIDRDGHVLVLLERDITEAERQTIEAALDNHPQVAGHEFWGQANSLTEARQLFRNNAEMLAKLDRDPGIIPSSYRITLTHADPASAGRVVADFQDEPGVMQVTIVQGSLTVGSGRSSTSGPRR
jgi:FtsX extracellular domain